MKRTVAVVLAILLAGWKAASAAPPPQGEDFYIAILQGAHPFAQKNNACFELKVIGTAKAVPALAELLTDTNLSHAARYALEPMPFPEAENALLQALPATSGATKTGIIDSLGMRRDKAAVPLLTPLTASPDGEVATAAMEALGKIGGVDALAALEHAAGASNIRLDAILSCANGLLREGKKAEARDAFQSVSALKPESRYRMAAFRGAVLAADSDPDKMILDAITGQDADLQRTALQLAGQLPNPQLTLALANLLPSVPVPVQLALLRCLALRGGTSVSPQVAKMLESPDADVQREAIDALAKCGDAAVVAPLAQRAASENAAEKEAARQALLDLRGEGITQAMLDAVNAAAPKVRVELIRALGDRGDTTAANGVLKWAQDNDDDTSSAAFQAVAELGGPDQINPILNLVKQTTNESCRSQAAEALGLICQRLDSRGKTWDAQPLVQTVQSGPKPARVALLAVCSSVAAAPAREALRAAVKDADPELRGAAIHALCEAHDPSLLPDLVQLASTAPEKKYRVLAVRGAVRLATGEEGVKVPAGAKLKAFKTILGTELDTPEKQLVLSGLGSVASDESLKMAVPFLDDENVKFEAAQAVINIGGAIAEEHPAEAAAALRKAMSLPLKPDMRQAAQRAIRKTRKNENQN